MIVLCYHYSIHNITSLLKIEAILVHIYHTTKNISSSAKFFTCFVLFTVFTFGTAFLGCSYGQDSQVQSAQIDAAISENLRHFWDESGENILAKYKDKLFVPAMNTLPANMLNEKLQECKAIILSANYVEGTIISQCLLEKNQTDKLDRITEDKITYQFSKINGIPIVHIWPRGTSSFTVHGSFLTLKAVLQRFSPKYVFAVGVAFGADPNTQKLGDVLISERLVFYDSFSKLTNGKLQLSPDEDHLVGENILAGCQFLKKKQPPAAAQLSPSQWFLGTMLTGGMVLSDPDEKTRLLQAAKSIGHDVIGGEMEGIGIYFACNTVNPAVPFVIIKGICDWAVNKNGWDFVSANKDEQDEIKDCVQAFACENAFKTLDYIFSHISF